MSVTGLLTTRAIPPTIGESRCERDAGITYFVWRAVCLLYPEYGMRQLLNRLREFDRRRASFPGEHLIVAAVAASMLRSARRRSGIGRALALLAGGALLARASSGRDGLARLSRRRQGGDAPSMMDAS
jgi:hypothetical protein